MSSEVTSVKLANGDTVATSELISLTEAAALPEVNKTRQAVHAWTNDKERPLMCAVFLGNPYTTKAWVAEFLAIRKKQMESMSSAIVKRQARKIARIEYELKKLKESLSESNPEVDDLVDRLVNGDSAES